MMRRKGLFLLLPLMILAAVGLSWNPWAAASSVSAAEEPILVIDPGHGGEDGGAVAVSGATESAINLEIALRVDALCGLFGMRTKLLRETDVSLADKTAVSIREKKRSDLKNRVSLVNQLADARLLSIHQNFFESSKPHGAQAFFHDDELSLAWAQGLQESLRENLDPENTRTAVAVPKFVYLMRHVDCPAVLVECGFLSNPEEDAKLESPEYQKKLAAVLTVSCMPGQLTPEEPSADSSR